MLEAVWGGNPVRQTAQSILDGPSCCSAVGQDRGRDCATDYYLAEGALELIAGNVAHCSCLVAVPMW